MKNRIRFPQLLLTAFILLSCRDNSSLNISVSDSDDEYKFVAHFDQSRTRDVQRFINNSMSPSGLFSGEDDHLNVDTSLKDGTTFKVKESPGELTIRIDKKSNSPASVQRIRNMCEGVKKVITDE
jgi:hypothetical protein